MLEYTIRDASIEEFESAGQLMYSVYENLEGFPSPEEQPHYYHMLLNIGALTKKPQTRLLIAISENGQIGGGVVYFGEMAQYGSGGKATLEKNAAGFRLLAVNPKSRGHGLGKKLTQVCIELAKSSNRTSMVIHTTMTMPIAWKMYQKMGFKRAPELDFLQGKLEVFGFRLML